MSLKSQSARVIYSLINQRIAKIGCMAFAVFVTVGAAGPLELGVFGQGNTSGGFRGLVRDKATGNALSGAKVVLRNQQFGTQATVITDEKGLYSKGSLPPGDYDIDVSANGYLPAKKVQTLYAMANYVVEPDPFDLVPETAIGGPGPVVTGSPGLPTPAPTPVAPAGVQEQARSENIDLNPRRVGIFDRASVVGLPLGSSTFTRTFDELGFLVPGVNPPPQAIGNSVGPGVGGGVGTSGQFSVNGLRSRANNFTVDGSDNNDEDIGVRRQGFFSLVPQPIESIQEFQITTLLAPAEFGRNLGAQVNALSRSGGNRFGGSIYGMYNSDRLNAANFFDNTNGNSTIDLTAQRRNGLTVPVLVDGVQKQVSNLAGGKDKFKLLQGGFAVGGPIVKNKLFFFVSGEEQHLDATRERHFAVPTVEQRGLFNSGAEGLMTSGGSPVFPTSVGGDVIFSFFPFPNDPTGVYGRNTYTRELPADARGRILSGRMDWNLFKIHGNPQTLTARYNYTDDKRDLPDVGGALFSSIRPVVRTDNFSSFLSGSLTNRVSNELRLSWGRTRLRFDELRDSSFLLPTRRSFTNAADGRFLLNAPLLFNTTLPGNSGASYASGGETETRSLTFVPGVPTSTNMFGPIGQLIVAGFSPVGVDVFNFPQSRKNDTYQIADTLRWQVANHAVAFGTDFRRTFLNSDLPRNSRPLVTFNGAPDVLNIGNCGTPFCSPSDFAAAGAATGFFQSLVLPNNNAQIELRYYQFDFFGQDEWRVRHNLTVSLGLRYEYNTPPKEASNKIENSFQQQQLPPFISGLANFIDGRTKIFDPDKNNIAPRLGFAYAPTASTVIRGGYGIYYDQILGAVVSQSRNVFPTFTTVNFGGGLQYNQNNGTFAFNPFNPITGFFGTIPIIQPGTINTINPNIDVQALRQAIFNIFPSQNGTSFGATLPQRRLQTPFAHQYSVGIEHRFFKSTFVSMAYVGTTGRKLLRFTTPNLGSNYLPLITSIFAVNSQPIVQGRTFAPFSNATTLQRPVANIGPIEQFETTGRSQYHSFQMEVRGRLTNKFQYHASYVVGSARDDVSDVFDLAGAYALPQNSLTFAGEYAAANFDVRHRFTYDFTYGLPRFQNRNDLIRHLVGGWELSGTGKFNTGQPFTVNSIYDVNQDGNLTDRINSTAFITRTDQRDRPLTRTCTTAAQCQSVLAAFGQDGSVRRNSFRGGSVLDLDASISRRFRVAEKQNIQFRVDFFNFINRANFGVPVRIFESPGFGRPVETITPGSRVQFALKYNF